MPPALRHDPIPVSLAAEARLAELGLRAMHIRIDGDIAHIEADPRDLWRVVARRDEVVSRLRNLGFDRVTIDLDPTHRANAELPAFH